MNDSVSNPFQAPQARVADVRTGTGDFVAEGRRVPAGAGMAWFSSGWDLFRMQSGIWIGMIVTFGVIIIVLSMIPLLGLGLHLIVPVFSGGMMLGCKALDDGEELHFSHLFAGFRRQFGKLALVGLFNLLGFFLIGVVVALLVGVTGAGAFLAGRGGSGTNFLVIVLMAVALGIPLAMAAWFAPALVVLQEVPTLRALRLSFLACLKNFVPFLVYGVVGLVLAIVATIPIMLGWLALGPTLYASIYAAYRDIFTGGKA